VSTSDFWIFRDQREPVGGAELVDVVRREVRRALHFYDLDAGVDALIRAGSLECGLADADAAGAPEAAAVTDALARNLLQRDPDSLHQALGRLDRIQVPQALAVSQPEGFSYYALHPRDFSELAEGLPEGSGYAVVGIRSVGTTLSAMITARMHRLGRHAQRMTVRPGGHPYNRTLQLTSRQMAWVKKLEENGSVFVIADEGPGRSGSTFLSVAEALREARVPAHRIVLVGSHSPDATSLCAHDAETRWREFHFVGAKRWACGRYEGLPYLGGGEWRKVFMPGDESEWPACWPQMERMKFLSADGEQIIKFEGLSTHGKSVRARAQCLAETGFGPHWDLSENGFVHYRKIVGRRLRAADVTRTDVERLAAYCALRSREFRCDRNTDANFADMIAFNLSVEFGEGVPFGEDFVSEAPVITDSRMGPHEWVRNQAGHLIKTDGVSHGDDHFFPGAVDIAWDLAGAAIEWKLSRDAERFLLETYRKQTGDNVRTRLQKYKIAYAIFRLGCCRMALPTTQGTTDETKLLAEIGRYRNVLRMLFSDVTAGRAELRPAA
jgi:hypothetical protein